MFFFAHSVQQLCEPSGLLMSVVFIKMIPPTFCKHVLSVYVFVNESMTWAEAQRYCRDKYTDLATIENEQQTVQLIDTVNDDSIDLAWIGLYDDLNSGRERDFRNWHDPGPDNYGGQSLCVYMDNGIWFTTYCFNYRTFICYDGKQFN
uniref:C-type lectin domain-containing protein n=1 Tax=Sinocyclocheilus anshuiensis TaxID=1608454 RepID=A0A671QJ56_9TELE